MNDYETMKKDAGEKAAESVRDGMIVGLGTGSTIYYTVIHLGKMARDGLSFTGIPTSKATEKLAITHGIKLGTLEQHPAIDLTIDGADEVAPNLDLIKGMGGALLREKVVASASKQLIIVADESKAVDVLGTKSPLPVEVLPFALGAVTGKLESLCKEAKLRLRNGYPYVSDNGNYIIDCRFESIQDPEELEFTINRIPGVVENGLFLGMAERVIIGTADGLRILEKTT